MSSLSHTAIFIDENTSANWVLAQLQLPHPPYPFEGLKNLNKAFYTKESIEQLTDEEYRHGEYLTATINGNSFSTSSEGEQKKALLNYLLLQSPDCLIIDGAKDHLDQSAQKLMVQRLQAIAEKIIIIQLFTRHADKLPFIHQSFCVKNNVFEILNTTTPNEKSDPDFSAIRLPEPLQKTIFSPPLICLKNVSVSYEGKAILNNINWIINPGEFWQLTGPNGSGKTTLISLITGDNPKAYGQNITLFGYTKGSGESVWDIKQNIGYFSNYMLRRFTTSDTAEDMLVSGFLDSVGLYNYPGTHQLQLAQNWLKLLGIYHQRHQAFFSFSPGYQRLILIARAMIKHPPLLILDEPTADLTDAQAALIVALINKIAAETSTAIIYVSHRSEPGLKPKFQLELSPMPHGSIIASYK